ncbi:MULTISPECIES: DnaJ domain-containing protein [Prochlorococcus]|uniref:Putative DnaJ domain-containing protein n=1 Tax=Prochlorococcus marinus str. MIT 9116 TaxID=167544 RepID=A0A0A1ZQB0_PROMR|nr:DnaJ domain-containing protein [Prochlorococcus marinus]KGF89557.1 putative DnaJ domain-containing protein [Prochlorococcus marinus str. MIT 9107]KGF90434.1 putative DnaJ domain-containing protein [Prochlorococcus marinus str. MIT 9116]KGF92913.1 putative DnaJ domain-containing protein [Prochlorococcus marinus str. MIT 9123]
MNIPENLNTKRISIDLPEGLITRFDQLRKEWGFRARGPVIEKLLTELLQEDDLIPKTQQQEINFFEDRSNDENYNIDENTALVLIEAKNKNQVKEKPLNKIVLNKNQINEKVKSNISLPNFVEKKVKNLRRSINSERLKEKINDIQINTINENELIKCRIELITHWKNLYGTIPNDHIIEASMDWFGNDIWPNLDGTENLPFTWSAANKLMSELCPFWVKKNPSLEIVLLMIGVLEDPFATSELINRVPTLVRRFVSRFKRKNRSNSFEALDSTMTIHGALKLLNLSIAAGSAHTLRKIKEAYKSKALETHPDAGGSTDQMRKLNEAYQLLKNLYRNKY